MDNDLFIRKGDTKEEHETTEKLGHRVERRSGSFYCAVQFPVAVKSDDIEVSFKNGVLSITLPKSEEGTEIAHILRCIDIQNVHGPGQPAVKWALYLLYRFV